MNNPIITVTLNPALDQTVNLAALRHEQVNIAQDVTMNAGGKGVNVAGCLGDWGTPVLATGILGRDNSSAFDALFEAKGVVNHFVDHAGATRINIKLVSADDGATTDVNLPGKSVSASTFKQLSERLDQLCQPGSRVVLAGSLPAGLPDDCYATLCDQLTRKGARVVLDTSGAALSAALAGPTLPFCIKPNRHELEQWAGRPLSSFSELLKTAQSLHRIGVNQVVVSLAERGALFVVAEGCWLAAPPPVTPLSSVGAGDALLAGWLAAQHDNLKSEDAIRLAMAFAAGKLAKIGPHLPPKSEVARLARAVELNRIQN